MKIIENNKFKITFKAWYGYFKYQLILFKLFYILVSFKSYINKILLLKLDHFLIVYLNEYSIYIKNLG